MCVKSVPRLNTVTCYRQNEGYCWYFTRTHLLQLPTPTLTQSPPQPPHCSTTDTIPILLIFNRQTHLPLLLRLHFHPQTHLPLLLRHHHQQQHQQNQQELMRFNNSRCGFDPVGPVVVGGSGFNNHLAATLTQFSLSLSLSLSPTPSKPPPLIFSNCSTLTRPCSTDDTYTNLLGYTLPTSLKVSQVSYLFQTDPIFFFFLAT